MQEPATRAAGGTQSNSDFPQCFPYPGRIFAITQAGINTLQVTGMGILSVSADTETLADVGQVPHFIGLNQIEIAARKAFGVRRWIGDRQLKSLNIASTVRRKRTMIRSQRLRRRPILTQSSTWESSTKGRSSRKTGTHKYGKNLKPNGRSKGSYTSRTPKQMRHFCPGKCIQRRSRSAL